MRMSVFGTVEEENYGSGTYEFHDGKLTMSNADDVKLTVKGNKLYMEGKIQDKYTLRLVFEKQ